jgi:hypothetical protein
MNPLSKEELRSRLDAIAYGPWTSGAKEAHRYLAPPDGLVIPISGTTRIDLDALPLSGSNKRLNTQLNRVLRSHFADEEGVESRKEILVRDSFDQALIIPQLYELAVQTAYLTVDSVRQPARRLLTNLLWSPAARHFVTAYDYIAIPMLGARESVFPALALLTRLSQIGALRYGSRGFWRACELSILTTK